jgi:type IV pilus assembly protein PilE
MTRSSAWLSCAVPAASIILSERSRELGEGIMMANRRRGFTLIELMAVVAIIGILIAISYPSYQNSVRKGKRRAAQAFMMDAATKEQQLFLDQRSYTAVANNAAFPAALNITVPTDVATFYTFSIALDAGPPPGFTITADPGGSQDVDGNLTLDNTGDKSPADKW